MYSKSNNDTAEAPYSDLDTGLNPVHPVSDILHSKGVKLVKSTELKPAQQQRISLGSFKEDKVPKGFLIEITPNPNPDNSVLTEITNFGTSTQYKLALNISNRGDQAVSVWVWQL